MLYDSPVTSSNPPSRGFGYPKENHLFSTSLTNITGKSEYSGILQNTK